MEQTNKYQRSKIYIIRSPNNEKYYIGSTIDDLNKRFYKHKQIDVNTCSSKEIINSGGAYIELFELYPCNSKIELKKREGELIREHKNNIV
jgi:hypothetical protein